MFRNHSRGQDSLHWGSWAISVVWVISETSYLISSFWQDLLGVCSKKTKSKSFEPLERSQIGVQAQVTPPLQIEPPYHSPALWSSFSSGTCLLSNCCARCANVIFLSAVSSFLHHLLLQITLWKRNSDVCFQMKNDNPWVTCSSTLMGKL